MSRWSWGTTWWTWWRILWVGNLWVGILWRRTYQDGLNTWSLASNSANLQPTHFVRWHWRLQFGVDFISNRSILKHLKRCCYSSDSYSVCMKPEWARFADFLNQLFRLDGFIWITWDDSSRTTSSAAELAESIPSEPLPTECPIISYWPIE